MRTRLTGLIIALLMFNPVMAELAIDDFERGLAAIEMGNPARAHQLWLPLAEAGNPNAQFGLGMLFMDGMGVAQDFDEAVYWLFKSADQDFPPAQYHLGKVYERGIGVQPDIKRAIHWWERAAEQDMGAAQYRLGQIYWDGEGVPVDKTRARDYLTRARDNGEFISSDYRAAFTATLPQQQTATVEPTGHTAASTTNTRTPSCAAWLNKQPKEGYTLQMVAGREQSSVTSFIREHTLTESHAVCAYHEGSQDWFGLFYGFYPTLQAARDALDNLPADLKANQPYLRRLSKVRTITRLPGTSEPATD